MDPSDYVNPNLNREKLRKKPQTYRRNYIPANDHEQNNDEPYDDEQKGEEQNENSSYNNSNVSDRTIHVEDERNLSTISGGRDHELSSNSSIGRNSILSAETLPSPLLPIRLPLPQDLYQTNRNLVHTRSMTRTLSRGLNQI